MMSSRLPSLRGQRISRNLLQEGKNGAELDVMDAKKQATTQAKPFGKWIIEPTPHSSKAVDDEGDKSLTLHTFSDVLTAATESHQKTKRRWRSDRAVRTRQLIAWGFNSSIYSAAALLSLSYGVKFKSNSTNEMMTVWVLAMLQVYLVVEPMQILVVVCLPNVCNSRTRVGRCCTNAVKCCNEIFQP